MMIITHKNHPHNNAIFNLVKPAVFESQHPTFFEHHVSDLFQQNYDFKAIIVLVSTLIHQENTKL